MLFSNYFVMYYIPCNYILIKSAGGRSAAALLRRDNVELSRLIILFEWDGGKFGTKYRFRGAAAHGARAWDLKRPERTHTRFPSPAVGRHCGFRRRRVRMEGALLLRRGYRLVGPAQGLPGLARTKRNGDDPADRPWLLRRLRHCSNPKPSRVVSSLCRAPVAFSA